MKHWVAQALSLLMALCLFLPCFAAAEEAAQTVDTIDFEDGNAAAFSHTAVSRACEFLDVAAITGMPLTSPPRRLALKPARKSTCPPASTSKARRTALWRLARRAAITPTTRR